MEIVPIKTDHRKIIDTKNKNFRKTFQVDGFNHQMEVE
jgi:hypothetical protein